MNHFFFLASSFFASSGKSVGDNVALVVVILLDPRQFLILKTSSELGIDFDPFGRPNAKGTDSGSTSDDTLPYCPRNQNLPLGRYGGSEGLQGWQQPENDESAFISRSLTGSVDDPH